MPQIGRKVAQGIGKGIGAGATFRKPLAQAAEEFAAQNAAKKVIPEVASNMDWLKYLIGGGSLAGLTAMYLANRGSTTGEPGISAMQVPIQSPPVPVPVPATAQIQPQPQVQQPLQNNPNIGSMIAGSPQAPIPTAQAQVQQPRGIPSPQQIIPNRPLQYLQQGQNVTPTNKGIDWTSIGGLLGQLGQAVTAGDQSSLGYQLGGIGTRAAQAQLYNRYLGQLISGGGGGAQGQQGQGVGQSAPNFPQISGLEALSLSPEMQQGAIKQLEESRSADIDRLYKLGLMTGIETPEQLLQRQIITQMLSNQPQQKPLARERINVNPQGKETKGGEKYVWNIDPLTGERVSAIGPDYETFGAGQGGGGGNIQVQYRQNDNSARQLALARLKLKYPESIIKNPVTGQLDIGFVPPGSNLLGDFNNEYLTSVQFFQSQGLLPPGWEQITGIQGAPQVQAPGTVAAPTVTGKPKYPGTNPGTNPGTK